MQDDKTIMVKVNEDLHPKTKRFPFVDKNGGSHESVAAAFVKVTEGRISMLTVSQILATLVKIMLAQFTQHKDTLGGLLRTTIGKNFILTQKKVDFLPGEPEKGWGYLYGVALAKARTLFINMSEGQKYEESTGAVPPGCQPCLRCGGHGRVAGTGYYLSVSDPKYPGGWKYIGPCFDCLPKGQTERGLGYITRSKARHNWTYAHDAHNTERWNDNHVGIEENLWNPDDSSLWKFTPVCSVCGIEAGKGVTLIVGRNDSPTLCQNCIRANPESVTNMKEVTLNVDSEEVPT